MTKDRTVRFSTAATELDLDDTDSLDLDLSIRSLYKNASKISRAAEPMKRLQKTYAIKIVIVVYHIHGKIIFYV